VKVILENAYLTKEEIVKACQLCEAAGADYVKTSTGFAPTGAILEDVILMRASVSSKVEVKSAGGVKSLDMLLSFMDAGVKRSGASGTAAMLDEFKARFGG
jgi:deoxyribose-phosphate aldolase